MLTTILAGILMLVIVVVIHEGGHALAARLCGVGVAEFSIGFGSPRIKLFIFRKTPIYLCLWLFGGYVRLKTKKDGKSHNANGKFFEDAALWQKVFIFSAGILANLISAVFLRMILFIVAPEGFTFKFFIFPVTLAVAPVWYLIPIYAVKWVFYTFWLQFSAMMSNILMLVPRLIQSIIFASPVEHGGMIGTVALASTIHSGFWFYVGTIYYLSLILAVINLLPIFPLDGGNIAMEILKKVIHRIFGEGEYYGESAVYYWSVRIYAYLGWFIIALLFLNMIMSDIKDIITFFSG